MERIESLRIDERNALLARLRVALDDDPRVVAAWLYGSLGRGEGDAWSDLDVWVVLADDAYAPDVRHEFPPRLGDVLFTEEAPQNGPPGGTYLMSAHDAPTGPHLVDWYLQPLRFARQWESRVVLVDRVVFRDVPEDAAPNAAFSGSAEEDAANKAALFWAMLLVQGKWVARRPGEEDMGFEGFILSLLRNVAAWKGVSLDLTETPGLCRAGDRLDRLLGLAARMGSVAPEFSTPRKKVERFFATVGERYRSAKKEE